MLRSFSVLPSYAMSLLLILAGIWIAFIIRPLHLSIFFVVWGALSLFFCIMSQKKFSQGKKLEAGVYMILNGFFLLPYLVGILGLVYGFKLCRDSDRDAMVSHKEGQTSTTQS